MQKNFILWFGWKEAGEASADPSRMSLNRMNGDAHEWLPTWCYSGGSWLAFLLLTPGLPSSFFLQDFISNMISVDAFKLLNTIDSYECTNERSMVKTMLTDSRVSIEGFPFLSLAIIVYIRRLTVNWNNTVNSLIDHVLLKQLINSLTVVLIIHSSLPSVKIESSSYIDYVATPANRKRVPLT